MGRTARWILRRTWSPECATWVYAKWKPHGICFSRIHIDSVTIPIHLARGQHAQLQGLVCCMSCCVVVAARHLAQRHSMEVGEHV